MLQRWLSFKLIIQSSWAVRHADCSSGAVWIYVNILYYILYLGGDVDFRRRWASEVVYVMRFFFFGFLDTHVTGTVNVFFFFALRECATRGTYNYSREVLPQCEVVSAGVRWLSEKEDLSIDFFFSWLQVEFGGKGREEKATRPTVCQTCFAYKLKPHALQPENVSRAAQRCILDGWFDYSGPDPPSRAFS
jgi:hypothetical protein